MDSMARSTGGRAVMGSTCLRRANTAAENSEFPTSPTVVASKSDTGRASIAAQPERRRGGETNANRPG